MNITLNIQAPELAKALESLAAALTLTGGQATPNIPGLAIGGQSLSPVAQQQQPVPNAVPVQHPQVQHPATVDPFQQQQQPMHQPTAPPQGVPTSAPVYTMDQLAVAATQLMDAGRQPELLNLLQSFGVPSLMALPKEQYGAFATQLRGMGAKI